MIDIPNPFKNAQIVGNNYDSERYSNQIAEPGSNRVPKRGDKDFVMSRSQLVEFAKCPSRWRRGYREHDDGTDATEWGSLIDCLILDKDRFVEKFAIKPDEYPTEKEGNKKWSGNSTWCKDWIKAQGDKICLSRNEVDSASAAVERIKGDEVWNLIENADHQVYATAEYFDRSTGVIVPVKALIDIVPRMSVCDTALIDFKTARDANPGKWQRVVFERAYYVQAAFFLDIYNAATNEGRCEFRHIVQENFAPFEISTNILSSEFIDLGRMFYLGALRKYAECISTGQWPGYGDPNNNLNGWDLIQPEPWMLAV